ncbi:hypothetical protein OQH62_08390, partial [Campylobacter sp. MIT 21-1684]|uniref:hypothetical protein n=1 Tax=Campylobacter sp. MIT 21-1684 TaxID=2994322 RepID=UPI00224B2C09
TINTLTSSGSGATISNQAKIITLNSAGTNNTITNQAQGTISTFNSQTTSTLSNQGTIETLALDSGTLNYSGNGKIEKKILVPKGATFSNTDAINLAVLEIENSGTIQATKDITINNNSFRLQNNNMIQGNITLNSADATILNYASLHGTLTNKKNVSNLTNTSFNTLNTYINAGTTTSLTNTGKLDTLTNQGTLSTLINRGIITTLNNSGTITQADNEGTLSTFTQTAGSSNLNNSGTITTFTLSQGRATLKNEGTITTLSQNNGNLTLNNSKEISKFTKSNGTLNLRNFGTITDFSNANGNASIYNEGIFKGSITNTNGTLSYDASWTNDPNNTDRKIVWKDNASNAEKFHFKNDNGSITIKESSILLNINQSNTMYNASQNNANLVFQTPANGHLVVAGNKASNILFDTPSLIINPKENFSFGRNYNFANLVLKNDNGALSAIGGGYGTDIVNNGAGLSLANVIGYESLYNIEQGSAPNTFRIGVDVSDGSGAIANQSFLDYLMKKSLFIDSLLVHSELYGRKKENFFFLPYFSYKYLELKQSNGELFGHDKGFLTGFTHLFSNGDSLGAFLSHDYSQYKFADFSGLDNFNLFLHTKAYYIGAYYVKFLAQRGRFVYHLKTQVKSSLAKNEIENERGVGESSMYAYSADMDLAIDFFNNEKKRDLTFILGLGYEGAFMKGFSMDYNPDIYYKSLLVNLLYLNTATQFKYDFYPFTLSFEFGAKAYLRDTLNTRARIYGENFKDFVQFAPLLAYGNAGINLEIAKNFNYTLSYQAIAAKRSYTHRVFGKFAYWW